MSLIATRKQIFCLSIQIRKCSLGSFCRAKKISYVTMADSNNNDDSNNNNNKRKDTPKPKVQTAFGAYGFTHS
jgi:hypothetical protein